MMRRASPCFFLVEVSAVKSPMSRIAVLAISLPLLGCASARHEATLQGVCDGDALKRRALVTRRAALAAEMKRDVAAGRDGGVPGRSFDDRSTANADAYVRRVRASWTTADRALRDMLQDLDRRKDGSGCPAL